jgi:hypothetical protein
MNVARGFLVMGALYLLVGIGLGAHMGASQDHSLSPVHAHINLLGFTLMTLFGLGYLLIPGLDEGRTARLHFWLHQIGTFCLMLGLALLMKGILPEMPTGPILSIFEVMIFAGVVLWLAKLWKTL